MRLAGLAAIERARQNGRWEAAYDPASTATVPEDFQAALDASERANAFFKSLSGANRYALLFWYTTRKPRPEDPEGGWGWTLGRAQYDWLTATLGIRPALLLQERLRRFAAISTTSPQSDQTRWNREMAWLPAPPGRPST